MFSRLLVILGLVISATTAQAALTRNAFYSDAFYQAYDNKDIPKLKLALKEVLSKGHRPLTYKQARKIIFNKLFIDQNSNVTDVYCHEVHKIDPTTMPPSTVLNVEHTWPQSRFTNKYSREMQKTDLNILYPVSASANTSRNNHMFGEVVKDISGPCPTISHRGMTNRSNDIRFEPPKVHQGNVARAIFYFALRYDMTMDDEEKEDLLRWNRLDPVDVADQTRNDDIQVIQGNRNPFIDYPELVEMLIQ